MPHSTKACSTHSPISALIIGAGIGAAMSVALHSFTFGAAMGVAIAVVIHLARRHSKS